MARDGLDAELARQREAELRRNAIRHAALFAASRREEAGCPHARRRRWRPSLVNLAKLPRALMGRRARKANVV